MQQGGKAIDEAGVAEMPDDIGQRLAQRGIVESAFAHHDLRERGFCGIAQR